MGVLLTVALIIGGVALVAALFFGVLFLLFIDHQGRII